jgi:hypothetical protein
LELTERFIGGVERILQVADGLFSDIARAKLSLGRRAEGLVQGVLDHTILRKFLLLHSDLGVGREKFLLETKKLGHLVILREIVDSFS